MALLRRRSPPPRNTYSSELRDGARLGGQARRLGVVAGVVMVFTLGLSVGRLSAPAAAPPAALTQPAVSNAVSATQHMRNGVAVGYDHGQQGAVAAATVFATVLAGPLLTDPAAYRLATRTIAAPDSQPVLGQQADAALAGMQQTYGINAEALQHTRVAIRSIPLAWHVQHYAADSAEVDIWLQTMIAEDGRLAPLSSWATAAYALTWVNGDWRLLSDSSSDGPAPSVHQPPATSAQLPDQFSGWSQYAAAPVG